MGIAAIATIVSERVYIDMMGAGFCAGEEATNIQHYFSIIH